MHGHVNDDPASAIMHRLGLVQQCLTYGNIMALALAKISRYTVSGYIVGYYNIILLLQV